jgi:hypothetical protein
MEDEPRQPQSEGTPPESGPPLRESVSSAGERIQVIIEAAEKAAAGIIEDADAQARRYIDASRRRADSLAEERVRVMSDLTDTLVRQAEIVRRQSEELLEALDSARGELASRIGQELSEGSAPSPEVGAASAESVPRVPHLQPVESERPGLQAVESPPPQAVQAPAPPPAPGSQQPPVRPAGQEEQAPPSDGARLLAAQMAVAGSSRDEIEARLRDEFGIQDAGPILDGILGPGR